MVYQNVRAPFANGSLQHYANGYYLGGAEIEWRDDPSFISVLYVDGMRRGRSAAYFMWRDGEGNTYPMFMKDMEDLLSRSWVNHGATNLNRWIVVKRGTNYGIRMDEV